MVNFADHCPGKSVLRVATPKVATTLGAAYDAFLGSIQLPGTTSEAVHSNGRRAAAYATYRPISFSFLPPSARVSCI